jgi:APA family basic amino acid/polyamine antiporter
VRDVPEPRPGGGTLRPRLGLWQVTLAGIGVILGAGVYALIGPAAAEAGDALWLAFVLAALAAALTAYAYARLGTLRPLDSPEFQYTALAFGPRIGFVAGWLMLVADLMAVATVALAFGGYLGHLTGWLATPGALGLLGLAAGLAWVGIGQSVALAVVLTAVEAAGLLFVVAIGLPSWGAVDVLAMPHGLGGLSSAAALIFFAYLGFDELGNLVEEMRDPVRTLPRALGLAMLGATVIYVLVALAAVSAVGWRELAGSPAPLALVAARRLGPGADLAVSLMALAATANTVLLLLVAAARSIYGMAAAGVLPAVLGRVGRRDTPALATLVVLGIAAASLALGTLPRLAALTDATVLLSFGLVNLSLAWLAGRRRTGSGRARRAADLAVSLLAVVMCAWLAWHTGYGSLGLAAALALIGLVAAGRRAATRKLA